MATNQFGVRLFTTTETPDIKKTAINKSSLAAVLAAAQSFQAAQGKTSGSAAAKKFASPLSKLGGKFFSAAEDAITRTLGGGRGRKIEEGTGGFFPDVFYLDDQGELQLEEIKQIIARGEISPTGQLTITRASDIGLAGGSGVRVREGVKTLVKGYRFDKATGKPVPETEDVETTSFFQFLKSVKPLRGAAKQQAIIDRLRNPGTDKAALFYRRSLEAKASVINIPVIVGDKIFKRQIKFNFEQLAAAALSNPKVGAFEIEDKKGVLKFNYKFKASAVEKLLGDVAVAQLETIEANMDLVLQELLDFTSGVIASEKGVKEFLKALDLQVALEYLQGSVIMFRGSITAKTKKDNTTSSPQQRFISTAQLTALIQRRLSQIMPTGPRRGPPLSPNVLTERTGRFRKSVRAIPNYRNNLIKFFYDPIYKSFIDTKRDPDVFIAATIREIVASQFQRQFRIVRGV